MSGILRSAVAAFLVVASSMFAQSAATRPSFAEFEVASIKPTPPGAGGRWIRMQSTHEFAAKNHALKTLIAASLQSESQGDLGRPGMGRFRPLRYRRQSAQRGPAQPG